MAIKTAGIKTAEAKIATKATATNTAVIMTKKQVQRVPAPTKKALGLLIGYSETDVNGSYTGVPENKGEKPVQDADDL